MNCFRGIVLLGIMGCNAVMLHGAEIPVRRHDEKIYRLHRHVATFDQFLSVLETPDCPDRLKTFVILCCRFRVLSHRQQPPQEIVPPYGLTGAEKQEMFDEMRAKLCKMADLFGSQHMRETCQRAASNLDKPFTKDCLRRTPRIAESIVLPAAIRVCGDMQ